MSQYPDFAHCATALVGVGADKAFEFLADPLSLGTWSLASRWIKISLLYGALGIAYWLALLFLGKSPDELLRVMPIAAGISFAALFLVWLIAMRLHKIGTPEET